MVLLTMPISKVLMHTTLVRHISFAYTFYFLYYFSFVTFDLIYFLFRLACFKTFLLVWNNMRHVRCFSLILTVKFSEASANEVV